MSVRDLIDSYRPELTAAIDRAVAFVGSDYHDDLTAEAVGHFRSIIGKRMTRQDVRRSLDAHLDDAVETILDAMIAGPVHAVRLGLRRKKWSWRRIDDITDDLEAEARYVAMRGVRSARDIKNHLRCYVYDDVTHGLPIPDDYDPAEVDLPVDPFVQTMLVILMLNADERQFDILELLRRGVEDRGEIAEALGLSTRTVRRGIRGMRDLAEDWLKRLSTSIA